MNKTLAFIGLDFNLIKPYIKSIAFLAVMGICMGVLFNSTATLLIYFMMALMLVLSYPFAVGEKNSLDTLYGTLSLTRKNIVVGRYLFVLALEAVFAFSGLICAWILSIALNLEFNLPETLSILCVLSGVFSLIVAFQYPIYFKLGYSKGKIIAMIPFVAVFFIGLQIPALAKMLNRDFSLEALFAGIFGSPFTTYAVPAGSGLILLAVSCLISCRSYSRRDI